ncbi:MAG: SDR family oxidoreductase, partial [Deltaproteobacteria bacterium]
MFVALAVKSASASRRARCPAKEKGEKMHDYLLDIGRRPALRRLVSSIGLPVPQELERQTAPWEEKPLSGRRILVGGTGEFPEILLDDLIGSGAEITVMGEHAEAFLAGGKRLNHPVVEEKEGATGEVYGMLFDATGFRTTEDLDRLYDFFHPRIRRIGRCGRIVVLGRPPEETHDVEEAATLRAIEGFVRSVAREIGRKGATANLLYIEPGAEAALEGPLRFLCSPRSAYISGQPIPLTKRVKLPSPIPFVSPLSGKRALVTGAARGIGAAITTLLTREGAHVIALDRPEDRQVLAEVVGKTRATPLLQDVSAPDAAEKIAEALREDGIDIVVHNAGVTRDRTLAKMDRRFWREAIGINLTAVIRITQRLITDDLSHHNGRIVCLGAVAGIAGN